VSTHSPAPEPPDLSLLLRRVHPRVRCHAHTTSGAPCRAWAVKGCEVCVSHGGGAPRVRRRGLERLRTAVETARVHQLAAAARADEAQRAVEARALLGLAPDAPLTYWDHVAVGFLRAHHEATGAGADALVAPPPEVSDVDAVIMAEHERVMGELDALEAALLATREGADDGRLSQHHVPAMGSPHCLPGQRPTAGADNHGYPSLHSILIGATGHRKCSRAAEASHATRSPSSGRVQPSDGM